MSTAREARALARAQFARGERVEMGHLAEELGVNRATLFRAVGNREELLAELLWERMERGLERADQRARDAGNAGATRLTSILLDIFGAAGERSPERVFVDREPGLAMRVMTTGVVHERLLHWIAAVITEETEAGRIAPLHPPTQIADIVVRSGEAVFWFDRVSGRGVSRDNLTVILHALCPPTPS